MSGFSGDLKKKERQMSQNCNGSTFCFYRSHDEHSESPDMERNVSTEKKILHEIKNSTAILDWKQQRNAAKHQDL